MSEVVNTNKLPRRISYPRLRAESKNRNITMSVPSKDAPPINKDHVFKMSYETRDIHAADISMGSMNVMNSLKEKLALKSATGSNYEVATKTPSRVHAMLNEQLGYEEEEREERFHSDQTRTVPSKVFQALQYAYPSSEDNAPGAQKEKRYQENSLKQEDEEEYVRFRSSQTNTVPSKVFKALQYSYPTKSAAPLDPVYQQMQEERSGHQPYRTDQRQYKDAYEEEDGYGRFVGNPTNKVPSKVFQALQYSYDTPQTIETNSDTNVVHNVDPGYLKYSNHVPSKSFQRLQKQYNDEKEKRSEAIPGDLQDAIDLLEKELDAMTSSKTNPVIMVPLNRGLNRGQRPSEELSPVCPAENPAVQVPLHAHSTKDGPLARNNQQLNQAISFAPPVPVRIDSKRFQHQPRMSTGEDVVYQAPVAKVQGLPQRPANQHRSTSNSQDDEVIQAPVAHLENGDHPVPSKISFKRGTKSDVVAVACTSESKIFKSVALRPRRHIDGKAKGSSSLSITHKSAAVRRNKDQRADSLDSSSSYSSIQERIPDFDPDTYVLTTKPPSVSSHGIRSDSSESAHSHSSRSSIGQENRFGEETPAAITHLSSHVSKSSNGNFGSEIAKPRRMVININGKARVSSASKHEEGTDQGIAVLSTGIRDQGLMQLDNSDTNYHENSASINHSGHSEENSIQNDVFVDPVPTINKSGKSIPLQSGKVDPHAENQVETSTLTDLQLTEINSEQLTEMYVENEETSSMCDYFQRLEENSTYQGKLSLSQEIWTMSPPLATLFPAKFCQTTLYLGTLCLATVYLATSGKATLCVRIVSLEIRTPTLPESLLFMFSLANRNNIS
eukprot:gene13168-3966_t